MNDLSDNIRALLTLLKKHPELIDDEGNREMLRELAAARDALDDANSVALHVALADLEQDRSPEE